MVGHACEREWQHLVTGGTWLGFRSHDIRKRAISEFEAQDGCRRISLRMCTLGDGVLAIGLAQSLAIGLVRLLAPLLACLLARPLVPLLVTPVVLSVA